tara:strand:- start:21465 stop:22109 length:645 start_codon:yes stop_codon:yes gene_type:complete
VFYTIFGFDYIFDLNFFRLCILTALLGLTSKYLISLVKIDYFSTGNNQILVFALLPVTGFVITSAISDNIALSLGMVGALSIVRFRTPVKNPLELVIYFFLITLGIVTNVNPSLAINFAIFFALVIVISEIYRIFSKKLNFRTESINYFHYYLRIELSEDNEILDKSENLLHKSFQTNKMTYNMGLQTISGAYEIINLIGNDIILNYSIDKNTQ